MSEEKTDRVRELLVEQMEILSVLSYKANSDGDIEALRHLTILLCECAKQITLRDLTACESIKERKQKEAVRDWLNETRREALK